MTKICLFISALGGSRVMLISEGPFICDLNLINDYGGLARLCEVT